jgi:sulfonate transport system ATP-binding protein
MAQTAALMRSTLLSVSVDIAHIAKSFAVDGTSFEALRDFSLLVEPGEFVSLVGPSGCGKSTLLRLIAGLDHPDAGLIQIGDRPVYGPGLDRGVVFQDHRLFPWLSVESNIRLSLRRSPLSDIQKDRVVADLIALVGLSGFERAFPHQLSGGMSQRAAIARALAPHPDILLLDEPFGALDSLTRTRLQTEFLRIWEHEGITMLMVTHDVEEAVFLSDRIVVIEPRPGRIRRVLDVPLARPRRRADPAFIALKEEVLSDLNTL